MFNDHQKEELLRIARQSVEDFVLLGSIKDFDIQDEKLKNFQGAFVTLYKNKSLRGCIGKIVSTDEPLWQVVRDMAIEAATEDPRFHPVSKDELSEIDYEISVLSAPEKINDWRNIEPGKHGVIVKKGMQSGVFLPQVAIESGWGLEEFLSQLCANKAGLSPNCYKDDKEVDLFIFTAEIIK